MIYTIRFYDSAGQLESMFNMLCADDAAALAIFDSIKREFDMELCRGGRVVARAEAQRIAS